LILIGKEKVMADNIHDNQPNAAKLISSLRHLNYDNLTALADIVDNSIDAGASHVWIDIISEKPKQKGQSEVSSIIICDDGRGMDLVTLDEAMRLGSETDRNPTFDLGLYGMGLVTASISLGKRLMVITKSSNDNCLYSIQDVDTIIAENKFVKIMEYAEGKLKAQFDEKVLIRQRKLSSANKKGAKKKTGNTGTLVAIEKIDNCKWIRASGLEENLRNHLGKTFRKFISAGSIKIYINGKEVTPIDPIADFEHDILFKTTIEVEDSDIELVIAELKDLGREIHGRVGINIANQGFYILRNNREIKSGETFGLFTKHNSYNRLRIEFNYPGTLDKILSSDFSKKNISLSQSLKDKLKEVCTPFIKQVRRHTLTLERSHKEVSEDFSEVEKHITKKSHLLTTPQVEIEERSPKRKKTENIRERIEKHGPRLDIRKRKRIDQFTRNVKFRHKRLGGEKGPLYEAEKEKDVVVIYWNEEHPFYTEFVAENADNPNVFNPICYLVYSFATAELKAAIGSDSNEILENIRHVVGINLAVLLR
jgi:hypothetical protein